MILPVLWMRRELVSRVLTPRGAVALALVAVVLAVCTLLRDRAGT